MIERMQKTSEALLIVNLLRDPLESQKFIQKNHSLGERELPRDLPPEDLKEIIEDINKVVAPFTTRLAFSVHKETGRTIIVVMDSQTNEVIRQIPTEEMLRLMVQMRGILGMLVNKQA